MCESEVEPRLLHSRENKHDSADMEIYILAFDRYHRTLISEQETHFLVDLF